MSRYPNIEALTNGCISGRLSEWPALPGEAEAILAELAALREKAASVDAAVLAEREACAKLVEDTDVIQREHCMNVFDDGARTLNKAAAAIRARGDA